MIEEKEGLDMKLSVDIIYQDLKQMLPVTLLGKDDTFLSLSRPEFYLDKTAVFKDGHVYICSADHLPDEPVLYSFALGILHSLSISKTAAISCPFRKQKTSFLSLTRSRMYSTSMKPGKNRSATFFVEMPPWLKCWSRAKISSRTLCF